MYYDVAKTAVEFPSLKPETASVPQTEVDFSNANAAELAKANRRTARQIARAMLRALNPMHLIGRIATKRSQAAKKPRRAMLLRVDPWLLRDLGISQHDFAGFFLPTEDDVDAAPVVQTTPVQATIHVIPTSTPPDVTAVAAA